MIVEKDLLGNLKHFGLNSYEAKLWTALLAKGVSTAGELSDIANVPRSRSYDVLESLETKGFVIAKIGKPIQYIALPPQEVLFRVKKKIEDEAKKKTEDIERLKETEFIKELDLLHQSNVKFVNPSELSSLIQGRDNIMNHLSSMIKNADKSVKCMTTPSGFQRKMEIIKKNHKKLGSDVIIQVVTQLNKIPNFQDPHLKNIKIFNHDVASSRFVLVDDKEALIMIVDDKITHPTSDTAILIKSPYFVSSLNTLFDIAVSKN